MSNSDKNKSLLLIVVLALLGLSLYYNSYSGKPDAVPRVSATPVPTENPVVLTVSQVDELPSLPLLARKAPLFTGSRRNVFEFSDEGSEPSEEMTQADPLADPVQPQSQTSVVPPPPGSDITFVGLYTEKDDPNSQLAFINVGNKILLVRPGDAVNGRYHVASIENDVLTLIVDENRQTLTFKLND